MFHYVMDIVRDLAGSAIVVLFGVLLKRLLAEHDAKKQAEKDWRERVDNAILGIERRRHPRNPSQGKTNGIHSDDSANRGDGPRIRRQKPPDDE